MSRSTPTVTADTPSAPARAAARKQAWFIAALLFLFVVVNWAAKAVLGLAVKPISAELHMSSTQYGLVSSVFFLTFCVAAVAGGVLADRMSARRLLLVMAVIWALTQVSTVVGAGFGVLLASRAVLGAAEGPAVPVAFHVLYRWFPVESRGLPSALLLAGAPLGVVAASPALGSLISGHGWRTAFTAVAIAIALWAAAWLFFGRDKDDSTTAPQEAAGDAPLDEAPGVGYAAVLRTGSFLSHMAISLGAYWVAALALAFAPGYLEDVHGYDTAGASKLIALPWLLGAVLLLVPALLVPRLLRRGMSHRLANGSVSVGSALVSGLSLLGLAYGPGDAFKITCLVLGFSTGSLVFPVALTSIGQVSPARLRGGVLGTYTAVYSLGGVLAPVVTGRLLDAGGHDAATYSTVFAIGAVLVLAGAACVALFSNPARDRARIMVGSTSA